MATAPTDETIEAARVPLRSASRLSVIARVRKILPIDRRHSSVTIEQRSTLDEEIDREVSAGGKPPIKLLSFALVVVVPFLAALTYFCFVASDQYTAEARFAVRSLADQSSADGAEGGLLTMNAATQDAYVVTSFIHSPEILRRIEKTLDYLPMFTRDNADFLSRFNKTDSKEEFLEYWRGQVSAYIDGPSGIITLKVRSFRPQDSKVLAEAILSESEQLINELNLRAQRDMVASVRGEVERTGKIYSEALAALNQFQLLSGLLSPQDQAKETGSLLTGLLTQKLQLETRLFVLKRSSAEGSPAYEQLIRAQKSVDSQIEKLRSELTGADNESIARTILEFSKLETERLVAEKLYEASRSNYDAALAASLRKGLYVMVFVPPSLPEEPLFPKRVSTSLIIGLGLLVVWATSMLVWASVEDHRL